MKYSTIELISKLVSLGVYPREWYRVLPLGYYQWSPTIVNSGLINLRALDHEVSTGVVANSAATAFTYLSALERLGIAGFRTVDYDRELIIRADILRWRADAEAVARLQIKRTNVEGALADKGIGIRLDNYTLVGESYDTALGTVALGTLTVDASHRLMIHHHPGEKDAWYLDGEIVGEQTDPTMIPSGVSNMSNFMVHSIINGATGGVNAVFRLSDVWIIQKVTD